MTLSLIQSLGHQQVEMSVKEKALDYLREMCEGLINDEGGDGLTDIKQGSITIDELGFVLHSMITNQRNECFRLGLSRIEVDKLIDSYKTVVRFDDEVEEAA